MTRAGAEPRETMITVHSFDEVPQFASETEEAAYWATHELGDEILEAMGPVPDSELPPPRQRTRPVSIRLDESTLSRAKKLAELRHIGYQTLLKEFIIERLYEEEKREGLVG
jgi:hypothetical protein